MYDLVVLGGGSGGLSVASAAARVGAKVALIEKYRLGGECTHTACVPSKALIEAARLAHRIRSADALGIRVGSIDVDFGAVMNRVRAVVSEFAGSGSGGSLRAKGIDVYQGSPVFEAYDTVLVDGTTRISGQKFVIATGSRPKIPDIPGLADVGYHDNTTIWNLTERPASLTVIGAGPTGMELAQAFARLGTDVTVLADADHILPREDPEVSERVETSLAAEGITFRTGVEVTGVSSRDGLKVCTYREQATQKTGEAVSTHLFIAVGRLANVEGLNLDAVGIHADPAHGIEVDDYLLTRSQRILAIGDVLHDHQYTHAAEREAAVAFQNAVLHIPKRIDYSAMPRATFVDPEVATVGLSEAEARDQHPEVRTFRAEFADLDRARIDGRTEGFAKLVATPAGKILGATVVGENASLILQEFVVAMEHGLTLKDIAETVHIYPSYAGMAGKLANQFAADRLKGGFLMTALRWFYGFPSRGTANGEGSRTEETEHGHAVEPVEHARGAGH